MAEAPTESTERLLAFSDGVTAIAITLLILPLAEIRPEAGENVVELLRANRTTLGAFALSFVVIANYWVSHHATFRALRRHSGRLIQLNILWLAAIVFLPFPTALIAQRVDGGYGTLYIASLLVASLVTSALGAYLKRHPDLLDTSELHEPPDHSVVGWASSVALLVALLVSLFSQSAGMYALLLLIPAQTVRRRRRDKKSAAQDHAQPDEGP